MPCSMKGILLLPVVAYLNSEIFMYQNLYLRANTLKGFELAVFPILICAEPAVTLTIQ